MPTENRPRRKYRPAGPRHMPDPPADPQNVAEANRYAERLKASVIPADRLGEVTTPRPGRVTVVMDIYTQNPGGAAKGMRVSASRQLDGEAGAPSDRDDLVVGEDGGVPLLGHSWVQNPGWVLIQNLAGTEFVRRPTPEAQAAIAESIVVIEREGQEKPVGFVRPGMVFCDEVQDPQECFMRCLSGSARVRVIVTPNGT